MSIWGTLIASVIGRNIYNASKAIGDNKNSHPQLICSNCGFGLSSMSENSYCTRCGTQLRSGRIGTYFLIFFGAYAIWFIHIFGILTPEVQHLLLVLTADEKFAYAGQYSSKVNSYAETLLMITIFTGGILTAPIGILIGKGLLDGKGGSKHINAIASGLMPSLLVNLIIFTIYIF